MDFQYLSNKLKLVGTYDLSEDVLEIFLKKKNVQSYYLSKEDNGIGLFVVIDDSRLDEKFDDSVYDFELEELDESIYERLIKGK